MLAVQTAIGTLNDIVDAPADAGQKPGKPIPAGLVTPVVAQRYAAGAAALGVVLAVPSGGGLVALAFVVLAVGVWYDLRAKGTAWSWLPFAVGIPLLPVYGWYGAAGTVPVWFAWLVPAAVLAGAALAIANARADAERDQAAGIASVATALGLERSWRLGAGLLAAGLVLAVIGLSTTSGLTPTIAIPVVGGGAVVAAAGAILARATGPGGRERAWQAQAIGVALVGVGTVASLAGAV